jgi:putative hydrolase of HD superfamily
VIPRGFVDRLYGTATVQRWTDHVRPLDLTALGKHAHMLVIAWVIGRRAERTEDWKIDWDYLVKGSLYELLRISVLTDIKASVLDEIRSSAEDRARLDAYVIDELTQSLVDCPVGLLDDLKDYYADNHSAAERWNAYKVLKAASALATAWEFRLIEQANPHLHDIAETRQNMDASVRRHQYVPAVLDLYEGRNDFARFTDLCGRLRFQLRWSQTPILPPRPVLDHELLVAYLAYACALDTPTGDERMDYWRRYHACFGALFHDLPEVLTRDVIAPVKRRAHIDDVLRRIEEEQFNKRIVPLLPEEMSRELAFFAMDEFKDKPWPRDGWPVYLNKQDPDRDDAPYPGKLIEACDKFAAFMEAFYSLGYGIRSDSLTGAVFPGDKESVAERARLNLGYSFEALYNECIAELETKHGITKP